MPHQMRLFSDVLPSDLASVLGRDKMHQAVVNRVVHMVGEGKNLREIDEYLLHEGRISQDEREIITEALYGKV